MASVLRTPSHDVVRPSGLKGRFLGGLSHANHPLLIVLVGALFALSFDTMSQATLFSLAATKVNGWMFAVLLGVIFMTGMMVTDGMNGLWISRLLARADRRALIVSRVLGLTIAALSLLMAVLGMLNYWSADIATWSDAARSILRHQRDHYGDAELYPVFVADPRARPWQLAIHSIIA